MPLTYARNVGGSSVHYTANFWRFHDVDFKERSLLGAIPGASLEDWPISYAELEPYYTKVEWEIGVSGLAGTHPNEPARSRPYPMPPMPVKSSGVLLERGARRLGLHAFPAPLAIASQPYRGRGACVHCPVPPEVVVPERRLPPGQLAVESPASHPGKPDGE